MTKQELKTLIGQAELNKAVVDLVAFIVTNRSAVDAALATANGKITTLQGSDTGKSVRTIARVGTICPRDKELRLSLE